MQGGSGTGGGRRRAAWQPGGAGEAEQRVSWAGSGQREFPKGKHEELALFQCQHEGLVHSL